jgi:hypothetical protein
MMEKENFDVQALPALICWNIWREQNQALFEDKDSSVFKVIHLSLMSLREHVMRRKFLSREQVTLMLIGVVFMDGSMEQLHPQV